MNTLYLQSDVRKDKTMRSHKYISLLLAASLAVTAIFSACSDASAPNNGENGGENGVNGSGIMRDITSAELVKEMTIGWNLGNTLDVCQADRDGDGKVNEHAEEGQEVDETLWGNVMTTPEMFDKLKESGVNSVRIPVTWRDHLDENRSEERRVGKECV